MNTALARSAQLSLYNNFGNGPTDDHQPGITTTKPQSNQPKQNQYIRREHRIQSASSCQKRKRSESRTFIVNGILLFSGVQYINSLHLDGIYGGI